MSKVLTKLAARDLRVIDYSDESGSGNGFWLYLKPGWCSEPGLHAVHEWKVTDTLAAFRNISRCDASCHCFQEAATAAPGFYAAQRTHMLRQLGVSK